MIHAGGWGAYNIWQHSREVQDLYGRRCRLEAEEMTCHAQAAELLAPLVQAGDTLLDAGCGSGYFFHALRSRGIPADYFGVDATACLIEIGRTHLPAFGLAAERLLTARIEDLDGSVDHVVCINVLSNLDNYHRPLERLLRMARKTVILRESCHHTSSYSYVKDRYLDPDVDLNVHVNTYATSEICQFIAAYGFSVEVVRDQRAEDEAEMVIGYPHYWKFLIAVRADRGTTTE